LGELLEGEMPGVICVVNDRYLDRRSAIPCGIEARLSRRTHVCLGRSGFIFHDGEGYVCDGAHWLDVMNSFELGCVPSGPLVFRDHLPRPIV